jgi:hypothetical protein
LFLRDGVLNPGEDVVVRLQLAGAEEDDAHRYSFVLLSGQGRP